MKKQVEYELRVRIPIKKFKDVYEFLKGSYNLESHTTRVSFMSFFDINKKQYDLRIRKTNDKSEVVLKIGSLHSHDRTELSQPIINEELIGLIKLFSHLSEKNYIAFRETFNFQDKKTVISLVKSDSVAYIEYELINDKDGHLNDGQYLRELIHEHGFIPLDEDGFNKLNQDLDRDDWSYVDTPRNMQKLKSVLDYLSN